METLGKKFWYANAQCYMIQFVSGRTLLDLVYNPFMTLKTPLSRIHLKSPPNTSPRTLLEPWDIAVSPVVQLPRQAFSVSECELVVQKVSGFGFKDYLNLPKPTFLQGPYTFRIRVYNKNYKKVGFGSLRIRVQGPGDLATPLFQIPVH